MPKTATVTAKLEPELQEAFAQLAKDAERSVSDLACEVLANHVAKFLPTPQASVVIVPVRVSAQNYAKLRRLDQYTSTSADKLTENAVQYYITINEGALAQVQAFIRMNPEAAQSENKRMAFYSYMRNRHRS